MEYEVFRVKLPDGRVVPVRAPKGARDSDIKKAALHDLKAGEFEFDTGDTARAGAQGLSFGFSDEIGAAVRAPFSDKDYGELRDESRFAMDRQRELHPWKTGLSEVAGGLLTGGVGGARAAAGTGARMGMAQLAKTGAQVGAGYGAGAGLGYSTAEDVGGMARDTAIGAGLGAVASPLLMAGGRGLAGTARAVGNRLPGGAKRRAASEVDTLLKESGIDPRNVDDMLKANPKLTVGDLSSDLQQASAKWATEGSTSRLAARQAGTRGRIVGEAGEQLGTPTNAVGRFTQVVEDIGEKARVAAKPLYRKAYDAELVPTSRMKRIFGSNTGKKAEKKALEMLDNKTASGMREGPVTQVEMADEFQRALRDMINKAGFKNPEKKATLIGMRRNFNKDLLKGNPALEAAQTVWKGSSSFTRALEAGREAMAGKGGRRFSMDKFGKLNDADKQAYKIGLLESLDEMLAGVDKSKDIARRLRKIPGISDVLDRAFGAKGKGKAFMDFIEAEGAMTETMRVAGKAVAERSNSRGLIADTIDLIKKLISQKFVGTGALAVPAKKLQVGQDIIEAATGAMPHMNKQMQGLLGGRSAPPPPMGATMGQGAAMQTGVRVAPLEMQSQIMDPLRGLLDE